MTYLACAMVARIGGGWMARRLTPNVFNLTTPELLLAGVSIVLWDIVAPGFLVAAMIHWLAL